MPDLRKPKDIEGRIKLSAYKLRKIRESWFYGDHDHFPSYPVCGICNKQITRYIDLTVGHKRSRGMGGGSRDDSPENIQPEHRLCNTGMGSKKH